MNYSGSDLFELLENTIHRSSEEGPGDYQLVEGKMIQARLI
jgi:hypothetical protein